MFSSSGKKRPLGGKRLATSSVMEAVVAKEHDAWASSCECPMDAESDDTVTAAERRWPCNFRQRPLDAEARNRPDLGKRVGFV
jgi:hypothetical protein